MEDTAEFKTRATFDHPYPATKIMWAPKGLAKTKDLLATTGDYLRIWELQETGDDSEDSARMVSLLNNSKRSEYCAPLTSFDWNDIDQNQLATSSIDTTVAVWDIETEKVKKLLQAHDKEVYDVAFARHRDIFATVGADGSMRLFDLRTLEYSTIVCETTDLVPMLRVAWNKIDTNFLAACALDKRYVAIVDIRLPATPVAELQAHNAPVTGVAWASHSASHLVSCADDGQALIWDLAPVPRDVEDPILAYSAGAEINNLIWPSAAPEWVVITFDNKIQVLRV
jgi:WD repeat-containing protein 68